GDILALLKRGHYRFALTRGLWTAPTRGRIIPLFDPMADRIGTGGYVRPKENPPMNDATESHHVVPFAGFVEIVSDGGRDDINQVPSVEAKFPEIHHNNRKVLLATTLVWCGSLDAGAEISVATESFSVSTSPG
ncbi:MAG: hypothetical protein OXN90_19885, partial [Gemmatimonadota bacterium]|nr:hypothetical protein [Gemmatimonadota bacterium]